MGRRQAQNWKYAKLLVEAYRALKPGGKPIVLKLYVDKQKRLTLDFGARAPIRSRWWVANAFSLLSHELLGVAPWKKARKRGSKAA